MEPQYKIQVNKSPTYWNKEGAMGLVLGSPFFPIGSLIGGAVGAYFGKQRMEKERAEGKVISSPTLLNKNIWPGIVKGFLLSLAVMCVALAVVLGPAALPAATVSFGQLTAIAGGGLADIGTTLLAQVGVGSTVLLPVIGGIWGAITGKKEMAREYEQAKTEHAAQQQQIMQPTTSRIKQQQVEYGTHHPAHQAEERGKVWSNDVKSSSPAPNPLLSTG